MKKNIIFRVWGTKEWVGGLYYYKNIIYSLLKSKRILDKYNVTICVTKDNEKEFAEFRNQANIEVLPQKKWLFDIIVFIKMLNPKNRYIYYLISAKYDFFFKDKGIYWIPDFQYLYYPHFFSQQEVIDRNKKYKKISKGKGKLVLSSYACKKDFEAKFSDYSVQICIVPFISNIVSEVRGLSNDFEKSVMEKYKLTSYQYIYIPNQFWQHKNHIVVLKAIRRIINKYSEFEYKFVFTGEQKDYRNPEYYEQIVQFFDDLKLERYVCNLGFIDRKEQLAIMKNAKFIIQPSLFEGWGTVLEDAKFFDKTVLLSDIPVDREQKNDKCILFDPLNENILARLIVKYANDQDLKDSVDLGLKNLDLSAKEYSKNLEVVFD